MHRSLPRRQKGRTDRVIESQGGWSSSGAGHLSLPDREGFAPSSASADQAEDHPFRVDAQGRYAGSEVAGRGGMGEVLVVHDRRLGRDVALKRIVSSRLDDLLGRRLAREAWITARLEHPSIVPIYDAGQSVDGRLYYTMRLIHGRSLREALSEAQDRTERMVLLRQFLSACEAVAYAHSHGIVHRDLKPENIMVGAFGETQVVDWGLAGFVSEATASAFAEDLPISEDVSLPAAKGTPCYMSPEQARGEAADPRADVWALGAILHEMVVGERLLKGQSGEEVLSILEKGTIDRGRLRDSGASPEICAIIDKATALSPLSRYRDAGDVAADLARYLDGRRVMAHEYTTWELLRRLLRHLRVPLIAAGSALLAAAIVIGVSFHRISQERSRAVSAEGSARAALLDTRKTSSWALSRQSVAELTAGAVAEADLLSAHALLRGESVDARGVAAATRATPHPTLAQAVALPGCERVLPGNWELAFCQDDASLALFEISPPKLRFRKPIKVRSALLVSKDGLEPRVALTISADELLVLDPHNGEVLQYHKIPVSSGFLGRLIDAGDGDHVALTEGRITTIVSLRKGRIVRSMRYCMDEAVAAIAGRGGHLGIVCRKGRAVTLSVQAPDLLTYHPVPSEVLAISAAFSPQRGSLVIGSVTGELVEVVLKGSEQGVRQRVFSGPIRQVEFLSGNDRVLVLRGDSGGSLLWDLEASTELLRLPAELSAAFRLDSKGLVTGGRRAGRFVVGASMPPRALRLPVGISSIAISPDGRLLAAARSDGRVGCFERATGRLLRELVVGKAVVKAVDFSLDGKRMATAVAEKSETLQVFAVPSFERIPEISFSGGGRRLSFTDTGLLTVLPYKPPLYSFTEKGEQTSLDGPEMYDISATPSRKELVLLSVDGGIYRLQKGALTQVGRDHGATLVAVWPSGSKIATGHDMGVFIWDQAGQSKWVSNPEARLTDLIVSPDERYLIGGRSDGTVAVWRTSDRRMVAILRGHTQRVVSLAFAPDGLLSTAAWDGQILNWDLSVLETAPEKLALWAEKSWAFDLPLALRAYW